MLQIFILKAVDTTIQVYHNLDDHRDGDFSVSCEFPARKQVVMQPDHHLLVIVSIMVIVNQHH